MSEAAASPCPACGGRDFHRRLTVDLGADGVVSLDVCAVCGLGRRDPPRVFPFEDMPLEAYLDDWRALSIDSVRFQFEQLVKGGLELAPWRLKAKGAGPHLLEVGCGAGHLLAHARALGWRVAGVEPWAALADWARKHQKLDIETARIEESGAPSGAFDVVCALDVISHSADPAAFLAACRERLAPGGVLLASTPNLRAMEDALADADAAALGLAVRNYFFTPDALERLLTRAGMPTNRVRFRGGDVGDRELFAFGQKPYATNLTWEAIATRDPHDPKAPWLDQPDVREDRLTPLQREWRETGRLILRDFLPRDVIDRYCALREALDDPGGWDDETPYLHHPEIIDLCLHPSLRRVLDDLIGEPMVMHLNLTGWRSTQRDWHQDDYLNPDGVNARYIAVWIALGDITPECGPFEFVPGTHRWPHIRRSRVMEFVPEDLREDRSWPVWSERLLTPFFETELGRTSLPRERFLARKGDVLIWHARLLHRGSMPQDPNAERRAIIAHYTAKSAMGVYGPIRKARNGGWYYDRPDVRRAP